MSVSLFSRWATRSEATKENIDPSGAEGVVATRERVAELLARVREGLHLLTIHVQGSEEPFTSAVFKVDLQRGYLLLDELIPKQGNVLLAREKRLWAKTVVDGLIIGFAGCVEGIDVESGIPYFTVPLPEAIDYKQRRAHYRVGVPIGKNIPVHLVTKHRRLVTGDLRNISVGGLCVTINRRACRGIHVGDTLPRCVVDLPPAHKIVTGLEIRNSCDWHTPNMRRVGGRFVHLSSRDLHEIERFVIGLERRLRRERVAL